MSDSVRPCHPKEAEEQARNVVVFDARSNDVQNGKKSANHRTGGSAMREGSEKAVKV